MSKSKAYRAFLSGRAKKAAVTRYRRAVLNDARLGRSSLTEEQFNALPKETQRVTLAFDVLAMIRGKKVKVATNTYLQVTPKIESKVVDTSWEGELAPISDLAAAQANSPEGKACLLGTGCAVCAKGGLFMAHVMRADRATVYDVVVSDGNDEISDRLVRDFEVFEHEQYELIEAAFEKEIFLAEDHGIAGVTGEFDYCTGGVIHTPTSQKFADAVAFGKRYRSHDARLAAIMINMIKNGGTFAPADRVSKDEVEKALKSATWGREYADI